VTAWRVSGSSLNLLAFPLVVLAAVKATMGQCPLPPLSPNRLPSMLSHVLAIAAPANLVKMVRHNSSSHSTPAQVSHNNHFTAPRPSTPGGVVTLVAEIANILLAGSLLPEGEHSFARTAEKPHDTFSSSQAETRMSQMQANRISLLMGQQPGTEHQRRLCATGTGATALVEAEKIALRWWTESSGDIADMEGEESGRRNSLFSLGGRMQDEGDDLSVAILVSSASLQASQTDNHL
jgi:phosphatidylinositol 4-kinase